MYVTLRLGRLSSAWRGSKVGVSEKGGSPVRESVVRCTTPPLRGHPLRPTRVKGPACASQARDGSCGIAHPVEDTALSQEQII